jgi:hypothetical protein
MQKLCHVNTPAKIEIQPLDFNRFDSDPPAMPKMTFLTGGRNFFA